MYGGDSRKVTMIMPSINVHFGFKNEEVKTGLTPREQICPGMDDALSESKNNYDSVTSSYISNYGAFPLPSIPKPFQFVLPGYPLFSPR